MIVSNVATPVSGSATLLVHVPPGETSLTISNPTAATVYVGSSNVSSTNGFAIPAGTMLEGIPGFRASAGTDLYITLASGSVTAPVTSMLSTPQ